MSKLAIAFLAIALVLIAGLAYGGFRLYVYVEHDPAFCGSCHLMERAWKTWQAGPHLQVNYHTCHQQDFAERARIVWHWATGEYQDVPPHTRLARKVCEGCHLGQDSRWRQIGETVGHKVHVLRADLECLSCHLPSLHAVEPQVEACQKCHTAARTNIGGMVAFHCTTCHNFLAKDARGMSPERSDSRSERMASTLANWDRQRTVKTIVCQWPDPAWKDQACVPMVRAAMNRPSHITCTPRPWANTPSCGGRGGRRMTLGSSGSAVRASPGSPSVTKLIQRIWIGRRGMGNPNKGATNIVQTSPELVVTAYLINRRLLS